MLHRLRGMPHATWRRSLTCRPPAAPPSPLQLNEEEKAVLRGRMEAADRVLELIKRHEASSEGALSFEGELSMLCSLGVTSASSMAGCRGTYRGTLQLRGLGTRIAICRFQVCICHRQKCLPCCTISNSFR